jgi:hypothetical protein
MPLIQTRARYTGKVQLVLICLSLSCLPLLSQAAPRHVYLTWQGDTSGTITVNYQTLEEAETSTIYYDTKFHKGRISDYRFHATGTRHKIEGLEDGRTVHWVELAQLKPGETYYFVAGDPKNGFTPERKFQTIPRGDEKIRFVVGGDMGTGPAMPVLLQQAAQQEPKFGVVGGDIAYAGDRLTNYKLWDAWLDAWEQQMVTPNGFSIPMVLAIGNHEVRSGAEFSGTNSAFYFGYFAQQRDRSYYSRKFGKNFVIYLLDSGHLAHHGPEQAAWLDAQLEADREFPYHFAVYHVPLYPAYRLYEGAGSVAGRDAWLPIFDKHHLTTAFEHHDHVFKRTKLLRNNQPDPKGTLYLGDGCWGQNSRKVSDPHKWYEEKAASIQHFWLVDVAKDRVEYRAINKEGKVFDVYPPDANGAKEAEKVFESLAPPPSPQTATTAPPLEGAPGLTRIELTRVDNEATGYGTFQSHNQKVVANRRGIFMTHIRTRNEAYTAQQWRLSWSRDGGQTFQTLHEATDPTNPAVLETDDEDNLYLIRPDFVDGHAYLYRFRAAQDYRDPAISRIPNGAAGKYSMAFDRARRQLYYFAHNQTFHRISLDGTVLSSTNLLTAGKSAVLQYPLLYLDVGGILHAAWTSQKHGVYLYWDIHYLQSPDGGLTWRTMRGSPVALPVVADEGGPADRITLDDEFDFHTWLESFFVRAGKAHFLYLAQTQPSRQHYVRYNLATGQRELDLQPEFRGQQLSLSGLDGFFATRAAETNGTIYAISRDAHANRLGCLASDNNGTTWYDYAVSAPVTNAYAIGGCREITRDGFIIGSFTDTPSTTNSSVIPKVYFFKIRAGLAKEKVAGKRPEKDE